MRGVAVALAGMLMTTAAGAALAADTVVSAPDEDLIVSIYFEWDRSDMPAAGADVADIVVEKASAKPYKKIVVEGHTDTANAAAYSVALSERMAGSVQRYLVERGIDAAKIETIAYGASRPALPTAQGVREPLNRRVTVRIIWE